jgi:hypoxanthine phosphoribosyltransferase
MNPSIHSSDGGLLATVSSGRAKKRHIEWLEFGQLAERLAEAVKKDGRKVDLVVGIARGGIPLAMVMADRLRVPIDFINVKSYTGMRQRGRVKIISTLFEDAEDKRVLVVDDLVDEGETMVTIIDFLKERHHPRDVLTASLFIKPWSRFAPDYYLDTTDAWIVFPWEHGEFGSDEGNAS